MDDVPNDAAEPAELSSNVTRRRLPLDEAVPKSSGRSFVKSVPHVPSGPMPDTGKGEREGEPGPPADSAAVPDRAPPLWLASRRCPPGAAAGDGCGVVSSKRERYARRSWRRASTRFSMAVPSASAAPGLP